MGYSAVLDLQRKEGHPQEGWPEWFAGDPRWQTAQRVVVSRHFTRSRLLAKFLLYIVAETLEDRKANITEHRIGVLVFDRPQDYSSIHDNIVRTYARQLRRRLAEYFASEGKAESLHIQIPLGGYVPVFEPAAPECAGLQQPHIDALAPDGSVQPEPAERQTGAQILWQKWKRYTIFGAMLVVYSAILVAATWFVVHQSGAQAHMRPFSGPAKPLWAALFEGPENCYIVPADAGFNILEDLSHSSLPLADYVKGSYLDMPLPPIDNHSSEDLRSQQFTSFTDLQIVTALARLPEFNPEHVILRFPRQLQLDDLKDANIILLGSMSSNPWAAIAENNANFRIVSGDGMQAATILNRKPEPGEAPSYQSHWNEPSHETYAIIAYLPNLEGSGHILLLQGLDVAGTQAAAETLMHPEAIAPVLRKATQADGTLHSFEILLRSRSIASKSAGSEVIGSRIY
jgi:hypothetical protein